MARAPERSARGAPLQRASLSPRVRLIFYISGLLDAVALAPQEAAPSLARLVGDAPVTIEREGAVALLAPHYGLVKQQDWPLAPLRLRALGIETGSDYWLRATPVTMEAGLEDVRIARAVDDLAAAEARALTTTLSEHFAQDGLAFIAPRADDWYARCATPPHLRTEPLMTVIGRSLRPHLPSGGDAAAWRRWQQEIEMLLHDHPVNVQREQDGRSIANGVWLQHGGCMPVERPASRVRTLSDDFDLQAFAQHAKEPARESPRELEPALREHADIVVASPPQGLALRELDHAFATPMLRALQSRRVEEIAVIGDGQGKPAVQWRCTRAPLLRRLLPRPSAPVSETVRQALERSA